MWTRFCLHLQEIHTQAAVQLQRDMPTVGCAIHGDDGDAAAGAAAAAAATACTCFRNLPLPLTLAALMERMEATRDAVANIFAGPWVCWDVVGSVVCGGGGGGCTHGHSMGDVDGTSIAFWASFVVYLILHMYRSGEHCCTLLHTTGTSLWQSIFLLMAPV